MHVAVAWEIQVRPEWVTQLDELLKKALAPYAWVRPVPYLHVVTIASEEDRCKLIAALTTFANANAGIYFVVSPIMAGEYAGHLPDHYWPIMHARTGSP